MTMAQAIRTIYDGDCRRYWHHQFYYRYQWFRDRFGRVQWRYM